MTQPPNKVGYRATDFRMAAGYKMQSVSEIDNKHYSRWIEEINMWHVGRVKRANGEISKD